ncbi:MULTISPECIES: alternate-type signal peptide domain-containing protein [Aeromicrobium]|uniref:Alternate-type signal peptide domain-containing protein n=1 Tax=Aeromicrobium phoceense TaxID=2754045 RepID=A0A838XR50_9ACTN|nr:MULTISPECIES: alternate-type signal peptide domain-containing protein [Aeromicrobium]MBA4609330.1 alternate-type signal peptide domain-containing protein [Aeromicrobium phoceense]
MNKSTKGAVAAGAAAVLLLGGAGSLAYWNAEGDVVGGNIEAGTLTLTPSGTAATWTLNGTAVAGNDLSSVLVVPGDTLRYTGTWTIGATGDNLQADVDFTGLDGTASVADKMTVTDTYTLDAAPLAAGAEITDANDGDVLGATVVVDFPFGTTVDNTSQGMTLDLTEGNITLTQSDATP